MIRTSVESVHFQSVDGGFDRRVLAAHEFEFPGIFSLPVCFAQLAFFGKYDKIQQCFEFTLILWAVSALVPNSRPQARGSVFWFFDDFHGHLLIALPAHHLMVKDELILVLDDAYPESKFHRHSRLALADPLSVGLKDGEDFFMMRDGFVEVAPCG